MLRRICAFSAVSCILLGALALRLRADDEDPAFAQINSIVKTLSDITGWPEKHHVAYGRMSKRQLKQFLTKRIKKTLKPEELYADELALKMFGLVPQDFDLRKSTIDLLTEQAAAFYDYDAKKLFLLDEASPVDETTTLAHELSHALADQHFDLGKFIDDTPADDDENLAHTAVVEGQASWLMIAYDLNVTGKPPVPTPELLNSVGDSGDASMSDYPILKGSPLYIQQSLLFPYAEGILFFDAVYKKIGKAAFSTVFLNPPADSSQIIHPDRYFDHVKPTKPTLPSLSKGAEEKQIAEGALGEFDHAILLRQYVGQEKADAIAPHWRGGCFKIVRANKQESPVLEYASDWDSEEAAAIFFADYQETLKHKWKRYDVAESNRKMAAGTGDNGYFITRLDGNTVSSLEGIESVEDWKRLKTNPSIEASTRVAFRPRTLPH